MGERLAGGEVGLGRAARFGETGVDLSESDGVGGIVPRPGDEPPSEGDMRQTKAGEMDDDG
jgi:hypothetical protein